MRKIIYFLFLGMILTAASVSAELTMDNYFECLGGDTDACTDSEYDTAKLIAVIFTIVIIFVFYKWKGFV